MQEIFDDDLPKVRGTDYVKFFCSRCGWGVTLIGKELQALKEDKFECPGCKQLDAELLAYSKYRTRRLIG